MQALAKVFNSPQVTDTEVVPSHRQELLQDLFVTAPSGAHVGEPMSSEQKDVEEREVQELTQDALDDRATKAHESSDGLIDAELLFGEAAQSSPTREGPFISSPHESSFVPSVNSTLMSAMPTSPNNDHLVSNPVSPLCTLEWNSRVLSESSLRDGNIGSGGMKANLLFIKIFACASFCVFVFMLLFFCFLPLPRDLLVDGLVVPT